MGNKTLLSEKQNENISLKLGFCEIYGVITEEKNKAYLKELLRDYPELKNLLGELEHLCVRGEGYTNGVLVNAFAHCAPGDLTEELLRRRTHRRSSRDLHRWRSGESTTAGDVSPRGSLAPERIDQGRLWVSAEEVCHATA